jgi:hypothetical protein
MGRDPAAAQSRNIAGSADKIRSSRTQQETRSESSLEAQAVSGHGTQASDSAFQPIASEPVLRLGLGYASGATPMRIATLTAGVFVSR